MTPFEFHHYTSGAELNQREAWELARWQAIVLLSPNLKKGASIKPTDIATFAWEQKRPAKKMDATTYTRVMDEMDELYAAMLAGTAKVTNATKKDLL